MGDTWIYYDTASLSYSRHTNASQLPNVYGALFSSDTSQYKNKAESVVRKVDEAENVTVLPSGELTVKCNIVNYAVYKEVVVTATRSIRIPVNFSAIRFPRTLVMSVTAKSTVKDGDDFVRNIDIGVSFIEWLEQICGGFDIKEAFKSDAVKTLTGGLKLY